MLNGLLLMTMEGNLLHHARNVYPAKPYLLPL